MLHSMREMRTNVVNISNWRNFFSQKITKKYELYEIISSKIVDAVQNDLSECILFDIDYDPYLCVISEEDYVEALQMCLIYFVKEEAYEMCTEIRNAINKTK